MTKQEKITALSDVIISAERVLNFKYFGLEEAAEQAIKVLQNAIRTHGLYNQWSEEDIVNYINNLPSKELYIPLMTLWNQQTPREQARGSAEKVNKRGFGGKKINGKWRGDAAVAKRYVLAYKEGRLITSRTPADKLRKLLIKYKRQLTILANNKAFNKTRKE